MRKTSMLSISTSHLVPSKVFLIIHKSWKSLLGKLRRCDVGSFRWHYRTICKKVKSLNYIKIGFCTISYLNSLCSTWFVLHLYKLSNCSWVSWHTWFTIILGLYKIRNLECNSNRIWDNGSIYLMLYQYQMDIYN